MLNINGEEPNDRNYEIERYTRESHSGANWFLLIAGLSLINSLIFLNHGNWSFLAGLGVTKVIDELSQGLSDGTGNVIPVITFLLDLLVASIFIVFGLIARKKQSWAFIIGMIVYGLDAIIFVIAQEWLSMIFHLIALFFIYKGLSANNKLIEIETEYVA